MKKGVYIFICLMCACLSCTQKYVHVQRIPAEVPQMVYISGMEYHGGHSCEGSPVNEDSVEVYMGAFYMSKHEITNKEFCRFLNEDSILTNIALVKEIVAVGEKQNKIIFKKGKYHSVNGFENHPVVMVSWWGAKKYCEWLSAVIQKKNAKRNIYISSYRLPTEIEWVFATSMNKKRYVFYIPECNEATDSLNRKNGEAHNVKKDSLLKSGLAGMNENVYEWIDDNFYTKKIVNDYSMQDFYNPVVTPHAVVRKHASVTPTGNNVSCGRTARLRSGFYSDTGFRIVQTYLGKSSNVEF